VLRDAKAIARRHRSVALAVAIAAVSLLSGLLSPGTSGAASAASTPAAASAGPAPAAKKAATIAAANGWMCGCRDMDVLVTGGEEGAAAPVGQDSRRESAAVQLKA
jgi:hypothetical protein